MGRPLRIDLPGLFYHVTNRGVKRLPLFHEDSDRQQFLRLLAQAKGIFPFELHAYCLMTNHFHLLLRTINDSLSKTLHCLQKSFSNWFNRKYGHSGHVFQARFHSIPVEEDAYFTTVNRYIHLNPVHAHIVLRPEEYAWSNYAKLIKGEPDPLVDPSFLLGYFHGTPDNQRDKYKRFVEEMIDKPEIITEPALRRLRFWGRPPVFARRNNLAQQPH